MSGRRNATARQPTPQEASMTTPSQNPSGTQASNATSRGGQNGVDLKETASQLADQAKSEGKKHVETARQTTAESVEKLGRSVKAAASELKQDDIGNLSQYLTNFADGLNNFASRMREKSGEDIASEITRMARENPTLFVTGSLVIGFGLARFARAKTPGTESTNEYSQDLGSSTSGSSAYGSSSLGATGGLSGSTGTSAGIGGSAEFSGGSSSLGSTGSSIGSTGSSTGSSSLGSTGSSSGLSGSGSGLSGSTGSINSGSSSASTLGGSGIGGASSGIGANSGSTGSTGTSTAGSGTTGLNNYSPGSNLASGKGSSTDSIGGLGSSGTNDLDRSSNDKRGGTNS
ncbi:hypothetical protein ACFFGH_08185 [Lysobacter korlensis]|uniref:Uncharacterized protein n=1 Tax=Lysobacter korlensis TaxID=553636 RepID=A0ABV6RLF5_9GAMM